MEWTWQHHRGNLASSQSLYWQGTNTWTCVSSRKPIMNFNNFNGVAVHDKLNHRRNSKQLLIYWWYHYYRVKWKNQLGNTQSGTQQIPMVHGRSHTNAGSPKANYLPRALHHQRMGETPWSQGCGITAAPEQVNVDEAPHRNGHLFYPKFLPTLSLSAAFN